MMMMTRRRKRTFRFGQDEKSTLQDERKRKEGLSEELGSFLVMDAWGRDKRREQERWAGGDPSGRLTPPVSTRLGWIGPMQADKG